MEVFGKDLCPDGILSNPGRVEQQDAAISGVFFGLAMRYLRMDLAQRSW
jgi:hypothetical protein